MRVDDAQGETLQFDNMSYLMDRSVAGSTDWAEYEVILDVAPEAANICLGFLLSGTGAVWANGLQLEVVGPIAERDRRPVQDDSNRAEPGRPPTNEASEDRTSATAADPSGYEVAIDRAHAMSGPSDGNTLFVGRIPEQQQFSRLMGDLGAAPTTSEPGWSRVMLVHGLGGVGKSTLAKRFLRLAQEESSTTVVWIDWMACRRRNPGAYAADPGPTFEIILNELERACRYNSNLADSLGEFRRQYSRYTELATETGRFQHAAPDSRQAGPGPRFEASTSADAGIDDYQLLISPRDVLASAFAAGVRSSAARQPVLFILDTYEIVAAIGPWLRAIMRESGPRVAWVLCGRLEAPDPDWAKSTAAPHFISDGQFDEPHAFAEEVPPGLLYRTHLDPFDLETIGEYLIQVAPARAATASELERLYAATSGIPLAVRIAAFLWTSGVPLSTIDQGLPARAGSPTVLASMTDRFLIHLNTDSSLRVDRDRIYGLALALDPGDPDLISALWGTDQLVESFELLVRRHDFVLSGQYRLHDTVRDFLQRYLLEPFRRRAVRASNQRAVALLERRFEEHHRNMRTLAERFADQRWVSDVMSLAWHRFWLTDEAGWETVQAAIPGAVAYNPGAGRALLDLAEHFAATAASKYRLDLLRSTVGPISILISRAGADGLFELSRNIDRAPVEPAADCREELTCIVAWLHGQYALKNNRPSDAYKHLALAASQAPLATTRLRRWVSRSLIALSRMSQQEKPGSQLPDESMEVHAADLAVRLEPDNPDAHFQLATTWCRVGQPEQAVAAYSAAIDRYRELAASHADSGYPDLAIALLERAEPLGDLDRYDEAVRGCQEATEIFRNLAELDPDGYRENLAASLGNLGVHLFHSGQVADAATAGAEAVEIYRELNAGNADRYHANLVAALTNFAVYSMDLDRRDAAFLAVVDVVATYRPLATTDPETYRPMLASALLTLGNLCTDLERHDDATIADQEAVEIYRQLITADREQYSPALATALTALAVDLAALGRGADALTTRTEIADIYRQLATTDPETYRPMLASALLTLGNLCTDLERHDDATIADQEAVEIYRQLITADREQYSPALATALTALAVDLAALGRGADALTTRTEIADIYRQLATTDPETYRPMLASALLTLGNLCTDLERHDDATIADQEAVEIYRQLITADREQYSPALATALTALAVDLAALGCGADALTTRTEIADIYRQLATTDPETYRPMLASALLTLGNLCTDLERHDDATVLAQEAVENYRQLAAAEPDRYLPNECAALRELGECHYALGEIFRAVECYDEVLAIARANNDRQGECTSLAALAYCYIELGQIARSKELYQLALTIARELTDRDSEGICQHNLGICLADLGETSQSVAETRSAIEIAQERGDRAQEAARRGSLGMALADRADWDEAIREYLAAIAIADQIDYRLVQANVRCSLACAYLARGEWPAARTSAEEAAQHADHRALPVAYATLGLALLRHGNAAEAGAAFSGAVSAADELIQAQPSSYEAIDARALAHCGLALLNRLSPVDGIEDFRKARAVASAPGVIKRVLGLFDVLSAADTDGILASVRPSVVGREPATNGDV